jgi:hypothetical protein
MIWLAVSATLVLGGCGEKAGDDAGLGTSDGDGATTGSTEGTAGTEASGGATTGDGDTTMGDGSETAGDGDGDATVTYDAIAYPAALDRIFIVRRDLNDGTCAQLVVTYPYPASPTLITPEDWGYERSAVFDHPDACDPMAEPPGPVNMSWALEASGTVDWAPGGQSFEYPCSIDVDATITYEIAGEMWVPPTVSFEATALAVEGC